MRITIRDVEKMRNIMGERGVNGFIGILRVLEGGGEAWVFQTKEEVNSDPDLKPKEKEGCLYQLQVLNHRYAICHRMTNW